MSEVNEKRVIISKQYLKDIGNAIRNKLGTYNKTYKPEEMADAIRSIQTNTFVTSFLHDKNIIYSGTIGGCSWEISSKGVLFIYAGLLPDSSRGTCETGKEFVPSASKTDSPWIKYKNNIKLVSFEGPVIAGPDLSYFFKGLDKLWLINSMNYLDINKTNNISYMFQDCKGLAGVDFSVNDFTNITDMSYIFNNCSRLIEVKFPDIDYVDYHCGYNVQNLRGAFTSCVLLDKIDLSFLSEGKKITNMEMIFDNCTSLEKITTRFGKLLNLTTLAMAFRKCVKLKELDVSNWQVSSVLKNLQETFFACALLEVIDLSNWDISGVTTLTNMFNGCSALGEIKTDKGLMFASNANVSDMFNNCSAKLNTRLWDTSEMVSFQRFFEGWLGDQELDFSLWDTSNVVDMSFMFNNCANLTKVNLFSFEPYNCTSMASMFQNCKKLKLKDITFFYDSNSTLKLNSVASMFSGCTEFDEFHFPFTTYNVTNYTNMLNNCNKIKSIDFTSWIMGGTQPQVVDAQNMLNNCTNLRILYIGESYNLSYFKPTVCVLQMSAGEMTEICTYYCPCFPVYMYEAQASIQVTENQIKAVDEGIPHGVKTYYGIGAITTGSIFNTRIKTLVSGNNITQTSNGDFLIKKIVFRTATGTESEEFFEDTKKWIGIGSYTNYAGAYASWNEEEQTITIATGERFCLLNKDCSHMFQRFEALEEIISGALNSQIVTSLNNAFENCYSMEYFDFSEWKTPKLIDMANCFSGCRSLKEIDLSIFDTTSLSNITSLLSGALTLEKVTFFDDMNKSIYAQEAFSGCEELKIFNATHHAEFINSNGDGGINMMFFDCKSLETLNLTTWDTSRLLYLTGVFSGCLNLKSLDISTWAINSEILNMNSLFKNCSSLYDLKFWSESPNDGRGWYNYISPMNISEMFYNCEKLGTTQEVNNGEYVYRPGTFIFPRIHLKNKSEIITNASQRVSAQNVLVGCYGIETLDLHNLQIETTLPLNNDNLLEESHYDELGNWTPIVGDLYHLFEHDNDTEVDRFTLTTGGGYEKLYIQLAVQANTEYSWVFNFNAPEGYNTYNSSNHLDYYVTGYSNNDWQDQYNLQLNNYRYKTLASGSVSNKISSQPIEYTLNFNTGNYTQIRLFFNFGGVTDNQTKPYEFSNMSLYLNGVNSLPDTTNFVTNQAGKKGSYSLNTIITGNILAGFLYNNNGFIARMPSMANITYTRISNNKTYTAIPANTADTYNINYLPEMGEDELGG